MTRTVISMMLSACLMAGVAQADANKNKFLGEAILKAPVAQPAEKVIKGITWRCEGTRCTAVAKEWPGLDSFIKQCRTVAGTLGPLAAYRNGSRMADNGEIATCNRATQS